MGAADYQAAVPSDLLSPGVLNYRIILQKGDDYAVFPGDFRSNPFAWDNYYNETWKTYIADEQGKIEIYNPTNDRDAHIYPFIPAKFPVFLRYSGNASAVGIETGSLRTERRAHHWIPAFFCG